MADKDVKLVIQAKNAASKAIDAVSDSLKELGVIQTKTGQSAQQMDSLLGQLGSEFKKLGNEVAGLSAIGKIATELSKAETAVQRLQGTTRESAQEFAKLARETEAASQATARLRGEADTLSRAYGEQKAAVAAARKEQSSANAELRKAERLVDSVSKKSAKHTSTNPFGSAADSANVFAAAEVQKAKTAADDAAGTYSRLNTELAQLVTRQKEVSAEVSAAASNERKLTVETEKLADATKSSAASLSQAREELTGIKAIAQTASAALGGIAVDEEKIAAATKAATAELQRSKAVLDAMKRYSTGGASFADPKTAAAQQSQRAEMEKTLGVWQTLEDEARRLAVAMRETAQPTEEQTQAFEKVIGAARSAKAEYLAQQAALAKLQGSTQGSLSTLDGLSAGQTKLAASTRAATAELERSNSVSAAMKRYSTGGGDFADPKTASTLQAQRAEIEKARSAMQILEEEAARLAATMARIGPSTQQESESLRNLKGAAAAAKADVAGLEAELQRMEGKSGGGFLANFFSAFKGEGREAMSLMQRIRGEVLSLTTAYLGLYNGVSQIGGVIDATRKIEAAQNRLGVAFGQNKEAVASEFAFLQATATRLGISIGTLADEYSKFAVAAKTANFTSEETRKIFTSVAEAARVNKLSQDEMSGVFLALQQMISKGKVASEELRRQLGDRLTGAFNIFADAIGVTTAELDNMMQAGEVIADRSTMLKFADQLDKKFGPQLAESLKTTTTLLGQFWNEIFNAQVAVGAGGFIQSFNGLLREMIGYFRSRDGRDFFLSIGATLGTVTSGLKVVVSHFGAIVQIAKALLAFKVTAWFFEAATGAKTLTEANNAVKASLTNMVAGFTLLRAQAGVAGVAVATLTGIVNAAKAAFFTFLPTLVATVAAFAVGSVLSNWVSGVDKATSALDEHKRQMQEVIKAYEKVKGKTDDWVKALDATNVAEMNKNFRDLKSTYESMVKSATAFPSLGLKNTAEDAKPVFEAVIHLQQALESNKITAKEYREGLEKLYSGTVFDSTRKFLESQIDVATKTENAKKAMEEAGLKNLAMGSTMQEVQGYANGQADAQAKLKQQIDGTTDATVAGTNAFGKYADALKKLQENIPELKKELDKLDSIDKIKQQANDARKAIPDGLSPGDFDHRASQISDAESRAVHIQMGDDVKTVLAEIAKNTGMTEDGVKRLYDSEGGVKTKAYRANEKDPFTIGVGHTGAAGGIQPTAGMEITQTQGLEQFAADTKMFTEQVQKLVDFKLPPKMLDALVKLQFNAGSLGGAEGRSKIIDPLNKGDFAAAEQGIRNFKTTGAGGTISLQSRRNAEADQFHQGVTENEVALNEKRFEVEKKITDEQNKQHEATAQRIATQQAEATYAQQKLDGLTREEIIEHEIAAYKKENPNLNAEELAAITEIANKKADIILKDQEEKAQKQQIAAVQKTITDLESTRNLLIQQRKYAQDQGDATKEQALTTQIQGVNDQLKQAIANAIQFWQGIGGPQADAAILKLQTTAAGLDNIQKKSAITGKTINESLANGLVGAFDEFAQALANGEDALTALGTAFRKFAANFLLEIAKMILKQALLNALQMGGGENGGFGGGIASLIGGLFHEGGVVGPGMATRAASPGWFSDAMRYHTGGIAGLKPGEVPAILQTGEEVLTANDPRHVMNGGGASAPSIKIVNAFDSGDVVSEGLNSAVGEQTLVNVVRRNASALREVLGG